MHNTPINAPDRLALHNELHARPTARVHLPARIDYIAVLHGSNTREAERAFLATLPELDDEATATLAAGVQNNFIRIKATLDTMPYTVKWERHTEFTRYSLVRPYVENPPPDALDAWLANIPGATIAAVELIMLFSDSMQPEAMLQTAHAHFNAPTVVASRMGAAPHREAHSIAVTDFKLLAHGAERIVVIAPRTTSATRAGRIAQRLLEVETYRMMALLGLPVAKRLSGLLSGIEHQLATITHEMESDGIADQALLERLVSMAAKIEQAMAKHSYRFAATQAYRDLVAQRLLELREQAIPGTQTIGEFLQRRFTPAMATVAATAARLEALSQRVARSSDLLRTRVDIMTESQNQELLTRLNHGQNLQLSLQSTVEGLSIAAISYYIVSLLHYAFEGLHSAGLHIDPNIGAAACIPVVLFTVYKVVEKIHHKIQLTATNHTA